MTALLRIPEHLCYTAQSQKANNTAESRGTVEPGLVGLHLKQNSDMDSVLEQHAIRQLTQVGCNIEVSQLRKKNPKAGR